MVSHHDGQADFYVASDGDDGWSGTRPEPDATHADGPFATLTRARDAVRRRDSLSPRSIWSDDPVADGYNILHRAPHLIAKIRDPRQQISNATRPR